MLSQEKLRHDYINVQRLVNSLDKWVAEDDWTHHSSDDDDPLHTKWLKAQKILSGVKHARRLIQTAHSHGDLSGTSVIEARSQYAYETLDERLQHIESEIVKADKDLKPRARKRQSMLATLPIPTLPKRAEDALLEEEVPGPLETVPPVEEQVSSHELLLDSSDPIPVRPTLITDSSSARLAPTSPFTMEKSNSETKATSSFFDTSASLQTDLADQLAQMAAQLKRNAVHFADTIAKDQGVVSEVQEKIEQNLEDTKKERVRLRDFRGKSGGTTWIVLLSLLVVLAGWMLTFFIIRIT